MNDMISSNKKQSFFTIIIPVYNNEKELARCISSIINQTYKDIEIIIYDDGSNDRSVEIETSFSEKDDRIRLFRHEKNQSLLVTRLDAMKVAKGRYILFVDADDYISSSLCENVKKKLDEKEVDILVFSYTVVPENRVVYCKNLYESISVERILLRTAPHAVWNKAYSSQIVQKINDNVDSFYCNMTEDVYLSALFFFFSTSYDVYDIPLYFYVTGKGMSTSREFSFDSVDAIIKSVMNANNHLEFFFRSFDPNLVDAAITGGKRETELWAERILKSDCRIREKIEFLGCIDSNAGTTYSEKFEENLSRLYETDSFLKKVGVFTRTKFFLKSEMQRFHKKFRGKSNVSK